MPTKTERHTDCQALRLSLILIQANPPWGLYLNDLKRKYQTQVALWVDLRRCCYYAGGINDSCARRKSKMGWSEVATLLIGVVWA